MTTRIIRNEHDGRYYPQCYVTNDTHIGEGWQNVRRPSAGPMKNYCESFTTEARAHSFIEKRAKELLNV